MSLSATFSIINPNLLPWRNRLEYASSFRNEQDAPACKNNRSKLFRSQFIISRIFLHSITEEKVDYEDQNVQQYRVEK